jgi:hypothetical protein
VRRSTLDIDGDLVEDDWDNCPLTCNPDQLDVDGNGQGDLCTVCQPDLGWGGPGVMTLSVCGQPLGSCQSATLMIEGAPSLAPAWLFFGLAAGAAPFHGGTLVAWPALGSWPLMTNPAGRVTLTLAGGAAALDMVLQAVALDTSLPEGVAISNAVLVHYLP